LKQEPPIVSWGNPLPFRHGEDVKIITRTTTYLYNYTAKETSLEKHSYPPLTRYHRLNISHNYTEKEQECFLYAISLNHMAP